MTFWPDHALEQIGVGTVNSALAVYVTLSRVT